VASSCSSGKSSGVRHLLGDNYHDGGWWAGGLKKAVNEFVRAYPVNVVRLKYEQFVLRKARGHGVMTVAHVYDK